MKRYRCRAGCWLLTWSVISTAVCGGAVLVGATPGPASTEAADPEVDVWETASPSVRADPEFDGWYGWEPLGIIAGPWLRTYTLGVDRWEVFLCRSPGSSSGPTLETLMASIRHSGVAEYFSWWSNGLYSIEFRAGGVITADEFGGCDGPAEEASSGRHRGAIIALATEGAGGSAAGRMGEICYDADGLCPAALRRYPTNGRTVTIPADWFDDWPGVLIHELGHALGWPHAGAGTTVMTGGWLSDYDNPIDVMSTAGQTLKGTNAVNRYAAGWIEPAGVFVFAGEQAEVWLASQGSEGYEMIVVPDAEPGAFFALDARVFGTQYDTLDGTGGDWSGVEVYRVDQRPAPCGQSTAPCSPGRIELQPPTSVSVSVLEPGDGRVIGSALVEVLSREDGRFLVRIGPHQVVTCRGLAATIVGTEGPDELPFTSGPDVIAGLGGDDILKGGGGNDVICGGPGNDVLNGGGGIDRLLGDEGRDRAVGGPGPDIIEGGSGADRLHGSGGNDFLFGTAGNDRLWGEEGNDRLSGGTGVDEATGGAGTLDHCVADAILECELDFW